MDNAKIIAVDFDGTLVENKWPEIGAPIEKNIAKVKAEQEAGAKIILWTNRVGEPLEKALAFCEAQGIHLDAVNKNLPEIIKAFGTDCRKIFANEYWDDRAVPMSEKDIGEFSDGFHTFNSLYYQRLILFAALVNTFPTLAWKSHKHSDGEAPFGGGWFIVGIDTPKGPYTYHYEDKDWDLFHCKEVATAPEWDGHTDKDVERVLSLTDDESDWAAREVALASQKERESAEDKDDWDYGVACYPMAKYIQLLAAQMGKKIPVPITVTNYIRLLASGGLGKSEKYLVDELQMMLSAMNVEAATVDCDCIEVLRGQQKEGL